MPNTNVAAADHSPQFEELFARFLAENRPSMPDIDGNFVCADQRQKQVEWALRTEQAAS